jgi:hypothetical protein
VPSQAGPLVPHVNGAVDDVVDDVVVVIATGQPGVAVARTIFHRVPSSRLSVPPAAPPNETQ